MSNKQTIEDLEPFTDEERAMGNDLVPLEKELDKPEPEPQKKENKTEPTNPDVDEDGMIVGKNFNEQWKMASVMAKSGMVPDAFKGNPAAVLMAMQTATSRGLNPMTAIQNMANLFGRTMNFGELPLAEANMSGKIEWIKEFWVDEKGETINPLNFKAKYYAAVCVIKVFGREEIMRVFSMDDAKDANLLDDPKRKTWRQYPKRMLQMRARTWALRDALPEVTSGIPVAEYDEHAPESDPPTRQRGKLANKINEEFLLDEK